MVGVLKRKGRQSLNDSDFDDDNMSSRDDGDRPLKNTGASGQEKGSTKKRGWGIFSQRSEHEDEDAGSSESHGDDSSHGGDDRPGSFAIQSAKPVVETIPDSENEFHEVIRNQNWDLLEILLKEYDYKKYIRPKGPNKPPRKLRVAKYLPDLSRNKEVEIPHSPLYCLDALGRAPLHLCCISHCPEKPLQRLLFCARDVASVPDATGSLPIHLAVIHEHGVDVIDKLIRGYYHGAIEPDSSGRTPLMWAIEIIRRDKEKIGQSNIAYWSTPLTKEAKEWQEKQRKTWEVVHFMLENRILRRQKLLAPEYSQIVLAMNLAATPEIISLFLDLAKSAMRKEAIAGPILNMCVARQYPLSLLDKVVEASPVDLAKDVSDKTGRGVVAAHYRIGCIAHQHDSFDGNGKRESFRMIMQNLANVARNLQANFVPGKSYDEWWEKLKFLINLWGTNDMYDDVASHDDFDPDDLLLHNALCNADVPPSLIRLLSALRPQTTDLEHPKSSALPIHLACRLWRFKSYPPRRGEKETHIDKVVPQLLEGDSKRTRKRYKNRLPVHHGVASGHSWSFIKALVAHDRMSLQVRDPNTKLYPFQLAAANQRNFDFESLARRKFSVSAWNKMKDYQKENHMKAVDYHYEREQISLIFELLRHHPEAVSHESVMQAEVIRSAMKPKRMIVVKGLAATEEVALAAHMKMIRGMFDLGPISGHFIAWAYENTRRGWKTHRSHFGVLKEAIMDGLITSQMDVWWRKLKFWIWSDCPWTLTEIPRRDDFLLHAALCNPDTSPWIIDLILEVFPRSASIPLPGSGGCYPLHLACVTENYSPLPFEFPSKKTVIGMTTKAYPDAALLKWHDRLPLHLAIIHSKEWEEIQFLANEEPLALAIADPVEHIFPFQLMAVDRPFSPWQRRRFERMAKKEAGKQEWKNLPAHEKVERLSNILESHDLKTFGGVWELCRRNPALVSVRITENESDSESRSIRLASLGGVFSEDLKDENLPSTERIRKSLFNLSTASLDFLDDVFDEDTRRAEAKKSRENSRSTVSFESSISEPFFGNSYRLPPGNHGNSCTASQGEAGDISYSRSSVPLDASFVGNLPKSSKNPGTRLGQGLHPDDVEISVQNLVASPGGRRGASSRSSITMDDSIIDPFLDSSFRMPPRNYRLKSYSLESHPSESITLKDSGFASDLSGSITASLAHTSSSLSAPDDVKILNKNDETDEQAKLEAVVTRQTGSTNAPSSFFQTKKEMIVVKGECAYVIPRNTEVVAENYSIDSGKVDWVQSLQDIGKKMPLDVIQRLRHKHEQLFLASSFVDDTFIFADEDKDFVWLLCGGIALTTAENYDIEAAWVISSPLLGEDTGVWLETLASGTVHDRLSGAAGTQDILKRLVDITAHCRPAQISKKIMISRSVLRQAFGKGTLNASPASAERIIAETTKKLWFWVAKMRIASEVCTRSFIGTKYFLARRMRFERQRARFYEQQKKTKLMKRLKRKQNQAKKKMERQEKVPKTSSRTRRNDKESTRPHLVTDTKVEERSRDESNRYFLDGFEHHQPKKQNPLLVAAMKSKMEIDGDRADSIFRLRMFTDREFIDQRMPIVNGPEQWSKGSKDDVPKERMEVSKALARQLRIARRKRQRNSGCHLDDIHQPRNPSEDDDVSLTPRDIFDPPREPPPQKPMLEAARKAKAQHDRVAEILSAYNSSLTAAHQPKHAESDKVSLPLVVVFDAKQCPLKSAPFVVATMRAREQKENHKGISKYVPWHLRNAHQPATIYEEDDERSLEPTNIFDPFRPPTPERPFVSAALKAKETRDIKSGHAPGKLQESHQPTTMYKQDKSNFVPIKPPMSSKSSRVADTKARESMKRGSDQAPQHLVHLHQPTSVYEQDEEESLAPYSIFDPVRHPPPEKPFVAAAVKARGARERSSWEIPLHLRNAHQPPTIYEDDESSLAPNAIFDPRSPPQPSRPFVAAALKARQAREKCQGIVPRHLLHTHQPGPSCDDDCSLAPTAIFEPISPPRPTRPFVAAALKAKMSQSILKASRFSSDVVSVTCDEPSRNAAGLYESSPANSVSESGNEGVALQRKPSRPMTAKLVRMNSVELLRLQDDKADVMSLDSSITMGHEEDDNEASVDDSDDTSETEY